jgi:methyl-accepting chemotaxis protein
MRRAQLELEVQIKAMNDNARRILSGVTDRLRADAADAIGDTVQGGHAIAASAIGIRTTGIFMLLAFLGFAFVVALFLRRQVLRPVSHASRALDDMQQGQLDAAMPPTRLREFETIRLSLEGLRRALLDKGRLEAEQAAHRKRAEEEKGRVMRELADRFDGEFKNIVNGVSSAATEMQATAQRMSAIAEETSRQSGNVASASDQATANVQTVATTTEELSASIAEIGRQVMQSAKIARDAVAEAETTDMTVQRLSVAAGRIGEVVTLINDIAGQTNLLALNATIEAARAGESGKGFAVVAGEVKALANQTAKATDEISQQIASVQDETTGVVGAIEKIRLIIGQIDDIATTISSAVEEQGVSTQEIARSVQQAARGTQDVNSNIESVSQAAGDTGSAASQVLTAAQEMSRQAESLRGQVDRFLDGVRAA